MWRENDYAQGARQVKRAFIKSVQLNQALEILSKFPSSNFFGTVYRYEDSRRLKSWESRKVGDQFNFKGFMSTTIGEEAPKAIEGNDVQIKITITNVKGVRLYENLTSHEGEEEVLLSKGSSFVVTNVNHSNKSYVVKLQ